MTGVSDEELQGDRKRRRRARGWGAGGVCSRGHGNRSQAAVRGEQCKSEALLLSARADHQVHRADGYWYKGNTQASTDFMAQMVDGMAQMTLTW